MVLAVFALSSWAGIFEVAFQHASSGEVPIGERRRKRHVSFWGLVDKPNRPVCKLRRVDAKKIAFRINEPVNRGVGIAFYDHGEAE